MPRGRARLRLAALRRARAEVAAGDVLLDLARTLADVTTSPEAAQRVAEAVPAVTGCDRACVLLLDEQDRFVVRGLAGAAGAPGGPVFGGAHLTVAVADLPDVLIGRLDDTGDVIGPAAADLGIAALGIAALGIAPVRVRGEVRAVLTAEWLDPDARPDPATLGSRLIAVAGQAASALGNARLLDTVRHQALHDPLTGLPNQSLFDDRAAHAVTRARREGDRLAIGVLDLDRFKSVNDTLGHRAGDALLIQVADRLLNAVRAPDTVARVGGDEFALLLPELQPHGEAIVAERLLAAFDEPFEVDGHRIRISPSIGLAAFPSDGETPERLLRSADAAMYRAKGNGRNTWAAYASVMSGHAYDRLNLETDLHRAIGRRELRVGFQPIARTGDRRRVAVEALVRWSHPDFGILRPGEFVPLAEEVGLVAAIDSWVLRQACLELARSDAAGEQLERVAVNLSARSLAHPSLLRWVVDALDAGALTPDRLVVEVSETAAGHRATGVIDALVELRELGVAVALNDFGRGHSPLADLGDLPIDVLKIDRSFLRGVRDADADAPVLAAVVAMAHGLGLQVVAMGVETEEQLAFVARHGCDLAQGYLLGRATATATSTTYAAEGASAATA